jgi:hypothetical protein
VIKGKKHQKKGKLLKQIKDSLPKIWRMRLLLIERRTIPLTLTQIKKSCDFFVREIFAKEKDTKIDF